MQPSVQGQSCITLPDDQQASLFHGDPGRASGKMVAGTQRESGGEGALFQRIIQTLQSHTPGIRPVAEDGDGTPGRFREGQTAVFDDRHQGGVPCQNAPGTVVCQKMKCLKIGYGMVPTGAGQTAVKIKGVASQLQTPAGCQHGIGVVLFHRIYIGPLRV